MKKFSIFNFQFSINYGFTLIEVLVVVALMAILTLSSIGVFLSYTRSQSFQTSAADIVTILNKAKSRSQSQVKPIECNNKKLDGYRFSHPLEGKKYELGVKCDGAYHLLEEIDLPPQVSFAADSASEIFFEVSTAVVSSPGNIILTNNGSIKTITVDGVGNISVK